jgi:hypothetical protein
MKPYDDIFHVIKYLHGDESVFELCVIRPKVKKHPVWEGAVFGKEGIVAGWFDDRAKAADVAAKVNGIGADGIYVTLNPCDPALLGRANNRLISGVSRTQDSEITCLRWLLVDVDPKRPAKTSATDEQHTLALDHTAWIKSNLAAKGWPDPLYADSGNGAHLLYRLPDLENTAENVLLLKLTLAALSSLYLIRKDDIILEVDTKVFNPARISKLYGTRARKGDEAKGRPHRSARVILAPSAPVPVSVELLQTIIETASDENQSFKPNALGKKTSSSFRRDGKLDVSAYLEEHKIKVKEIKAHGSSSLHVLFECLFDSSHESGDAAIGQTEDGKLFYQCFHNSCKEKTWADARKIISGDKKLSLPSQDPAECIDQMNQQHAVIMVGGKCVVMNEIFDPVFERPDITLSSVQDLKHFYCNAKIWTSNGDGKKKLQSVSKLWIESEDRRQYKGIVFSPSRNIEGYYNLWKGFPIKPETGDWSLINKHIWEIIVNKDRALYEWLICWMADIVQNPGGEKPGTSVVLRGERGSGKGCFVYPLGLILGNHFLHITHQNQLTGKFNSHLKNSLLVFADECFWAGDKMAEGILKGMITEPYIMIEPKGKDVFAVKNHLRLIVASNEDWVVPAGLEERRFLVLDVSSRHMQDADYFKPIFDQIATGGAAAMLRDLLNVDLSGVDLRKAPKTKGLLDQIESSMDTVTKFWFERLHDGSLLKNDDKWHDQVYTDAFYAEYIESANQTGKRHLSGKISFVRRLKYLCPGLKRIYVLSNKSSDYNKREWAYQIPNMDICRQLFAKKTGMDIDWGRYEND